MSENIYKKCNSKTCWKLIISSLIKWSIYQTAIVLYFPAYGNIKQLNKSKNSFAIKLEEVMLAGVAETVKFVEYW